MPLISHNQNSVMANENSSRQKRWRRLYHPLCVVSLLCLRIQPVESFLVYHRYLSSPIVKPYRRLSGHCRVDAIGMSTALQGSNSLEERGIPPLTILLPAYNEVMRIGHTLEIYQSYLLDQHQSGDMLVNACEILVVDDGSEDGTRDLVREISTRAQIALSCVTIPHNEGKGAAIAFGIDHIVSRCNHSGDDTSPSTGDPPPLILIADADGSADVTCLSVMMKELQRLIVSVGVEAGSSSFWETPALLVGNRGYEGASLSRSILRGGFRTIVRIICGNLGVQDSQCGCKLMTLPAATSLYHDLYLRRWAHDVEVLFRAREWKVPVGEVTVPWQDKEGSKLVTSAYGAVKASVIMLLDVLLMRLEYASRRREQIDGSDAMG